MKIFDRYRLYLIFICLLIGMSSCSNSENQEYSEKSKHSSKLDNLEDSTLISKRDEVGHQTKFTNIKAIHKLPKGYKLFEEIMGDLNGDGIKDYILIVKGKDKNAITENRLDELVDLSRRGIMIYLSEKKGFFLALKNLDCFSSENEDGGVYYAPELLISARKGKLYIEYNHGRYGNWQYTFRYQNSDFELIGYDNSNNYGPIINRTTSINFLTKMKQTKENMNKDIEESGEEVFEEKWGKINIDKLYKLSEIENFDGFDYGFV